MAGRVNVQIASGISAIVVSRAIRIAGWWIHEPAAANPATVDRTSMPALNISDDYQSGHRDRARHREYQIDLPNDGSCLIVFS